jgi:2-isopropylmalate synthase
MSAPTQAAASDRVIVFDTTMRDGEQSPGASMSLDEKLELAKILEEMKVDVIEAGFPIASNGDFEAVLPDLADRHREHHLRPGPRRDRADIERAAEAIRPAKRGRIHTFLSTSPSHRDHILRASQEDILEMITKSVSHARNLCDDVEWSAQDATRTEQDFLRRCVDAAIKAGAGNREPARHGGIFSYPSEYADIFRDILENVPGADSIILSTHCHNDLGLAVANSLAGVQGGARQIEVAMNGIGERAGNAALEEVVMALKVRGDPAALFHQYRNPAHITRASRYTSAITGFPVQFNKAIVGKNAFAHESGIHQDGMLKDRGTYEIMSPRDRGPGRLQPGDGQACRPGGLPRKAQGTGLRAGPERPERGVPALQGPGRQEEARLRRRHHRPGGRRPGQRRADRIQVKTLRVIAGTEGPQQAELTVTVDGVEKSGAATGDGPVDAVFNAIHEVVPHTAILRLFQVHAVTEGTDAQAQVSVRLEEDGRIATGQAADVDTLTASAKAYVNALNNLIARGEKSLPTDKVASGF